MKLSIKLFDCIVLGTMLMVVFAVAALAGWGEVVIGALGLFTLVAVLFGYLYNAEDGDSRGIFPLPQFWKEGTYEDSPQTRKTGRRR
jgi:hypothetical protein